MTCSRAPVGQGRWGRGQLAVEALQSVLWALQGTAPLPGNTDSHAGGREHSFLRSLVPEACLLCETPRPLSQLCWDLEPPPPTPPGGAKSPVGGDGCVLVARPERPLPWYPPIVPTPSPTSSSLRIRLQHSFPPQMRCYVLMGAARSWNRASAPNPSCQEPRQGAISREYYVLWCFNWRRQMTW